MNELANATDEQLLSELLKRNVPSRGPRKVPFASDIYSGTIGIGDNAVATVFIDRPHLDLLHSMGDEDDS